MASLLSMPGNKLSFWQEKRKEIFNLIDISSIIANPTYEWNF